MQAVLRCAALFCIVAIPAKPASGCCVVAVAMVADQVLFWSDTVEHEVVATSQHAPPRLAVSFWFHEDLSPATEGEAGGTMSPLLQALGRE